jgi:tight adherence protein B
VLSVVFLALALASGAPIPVIAITGLAIWRPWWLLVAVACWAAMARKKRARARADDEADFLRGLAAELAAGASLRMSVVAAAGRMPILDLSLACRLAAAGLPASQVGSALQAALPVNGRLAAAAFRLASATGGRVGGMMATLAARAAEEGRLVRERRALTAQARASAWVVGSLPVAVLAALGCTGRMGALVGTRAGVAILAVGATLEAAGAIAVWLMVRRRRP